MNIGTQHLSGTRNIHFANLDDSATIATDPGHGGVELGVTAFDAARRQLKSGESSVDERSKKDAAASELDHCSNC
jgi:N-acetylmuramoyl-L-alanine amidase